jgi:polysaccharide export outer membrane protein
VILDKPISRAFTVSGQVNTPGRFVYSRPTSLMEALAIAGGPTNHAQMKNVMLFRAGESTRRFNLSDKELQKTGPPDVTLYPSDTVIVPRRWYTPEGSMILIFLSILTTGAAIYVATKAD